MILAQVNLLDISVVLLYLFLTAYLGWLGYRGTKSTTDYLVAGRKAHPFVMALSYGATFISTSAIVGFGGVAGGDRAAMVGKTRIGTAELAKRVSQGYDMERQNDPRLSIGDFLAGGIGGDAAFVVEMHDFRQAFEHAIVHVGAHETRIRSLVDIAQRGGFEQAVERTKTRRPDLLVTVEPALLGGVVVQVGDLLVDSSTRHRLDELKNSVLASEEAYRIPGTPTRRDATDG